VGRRRPQPIRAALGARRQAPDRHGYAVPAEATIRRTLARLDADVLAEVIGAWLADRRRTTPGAGPNPSERRRAFAVDGKTLRGAKRDTDDGCEQVHLLAAMEHTTRAVLAQREVAGAPGEVPGFAPLLAEVDLAGSVVTADALHTCRDAARFLVEAKHAHYLFVVKANRPALLERCARLAWQRVPVLDRTRDQAHGRVEIRTLKAVTVRGLAASRTPAKSSRSPGRSATSAADAAARRRRCTRSPACPTGRPAPPPGRPHPRPLVD
jgi:predicted transposase YbfD/YdcC